LDAKRCSDRCRQAASRRQNARIEAEAVFKTNLLIARNTHDAARLLEDYRGHAASLHLGAEHYGIPVRFMGMPPGILAVEKVCFGIKNDATTAL
jgi:hypothetical protein